jgi:polyphenol oxidase
VGPVTEVQWVDQVHSRLVVDSPSPGLHPGAGSNGGTFSVCVGTGDGLVATSTEVALAMLTADCASIALASPEGVFAAVHAGWRGLAEGVVAQAAAVMRERGATELTAALGPCIHPECYEFSPADLQEVEEALGHGVRGQTDGGRPALDMPAAVASALVAEGISQLPGVDVCTACGPGYFSHRARGDLGRQALVVWSGSGPG